MKYLLAHDLGTSGNKATLFSIDGKLIDSKVYEYKTNWFNSGWAEQNADDWYRAVCTTTRQIVNQIDPKDILGVSFSGQMMGCICLNKDGEVLHNPIIWADKRSTLEEEFIKKKIPSNKFYKITGHRISSSYTLAKLLWIKNNHPEIYNQTYKVLNAKDYIIYRLTGKFVTDYSDASGTNLLDINSLTWSKLIAESVGIDIDKMAELHNSSDIIGYVDESVSKETSLNIGIPIVCGAGDGAMSALGARSVKNGDLFCTIGTSAWCSTTSNRPIFDKDEITFNWAHVIPGKYLPCGTMEAAGASINWIKKQFLESETEGFRILDSESADSKPGAGGIYYLPYLMGERSPRWNNDAKGAFIGLSIESTRADMFRSVYEGIAYNLEIIYHIITNDNSRLLMTGGGAKSKTLVQIFADVFNLEIGIPSAIEEATSIAAAVTAGVGIGIYKSFECINDFVHIDKKITPNCKSAEIYKDKKVVFENLYQSLKPHFSNL